MALPVLLIMALGFYQLAWGFWARLRVQHAAHCAVRAYAAWEAKDKEAAEAHALRAAELALAGGLGWQELSLEHQGSQSSASDRALMQSSQQYQQTHRLILHARLRPLGAAILWRKGLALDVPARVLAEPAGPTAQ